MLDMDGIITDFVQGMMHHHNRRLDPWPSPEGDMLKLFGMTFDQFWYGVDLTFWRNLPWMHDTWQIMRILRSWFQQKDIYIVTSVPSVHGGSRKADAICAAGKHLWMEDHWPEMEDKLVVCKEKNFAAATNHLLIDDSETNVNSFIKHGGKAILLPRPWNCLYHESTIPYLERSIKCLAL